jgi:hypothetical protein
VKEYSVRQRHCMVWQDLDSELSKVEIQFLLTATAINLKKIEKMLKTETLESRILSEILGAVQFVKKISTDLFGDYAIEVS